MVCLTLKSSHCGFFQLLRWVRKLLWWGGHTEKPQRERCSQESCRRVFGRLRYAVGRCSYIRDTHDTHHTLHTPHATRHTMHTLHTPYTGQIVRPLESHRASLGAPYLSRLMCHNAEYGESMESRRSVDRSCAVCTEVCQHRHSRRHVSSDIVLCRQKLTP